MSALRFMSRWRRSGAAVIGTSVIALCVTIALAAPWIARCDPLTQDVGHRLQPASALHPLGTDGLGRDLLARLVYGARSTLGLVGLVVALMAPIGLTIGIICGYYGGTVERVLMGLTNITMALPRLVLALAFVGLLGPGLWNAALALVLTGWPAYARLARAETSRLRRSDYVAAAEMQGIVGARLLWGHLLPACLPATQVRMALDLAAVILAAAALGFLGLGVKPPTPEWGMMIAEGSKVVFDEWWIAAVPGVAILIVSLAFNLLVDGLRDVTDRRHEWR
jgi:peptide/nickel transport system permease protein